MSNAIVSHIAKMIADHVGRDANFGERVLAMEILSWLGLPTSDGDPMLDEAAQQLREQYDATTLSKAWAVMPRWPLVSLLDVQELRGVLARFPAGKLIHLSAAEADVTAGVLNDWLFRSPGEHQDDLSLIQMVVAKLT